MEDQKRKWNFQKVQSTNTLRRNCSHFTSLTPNKKGEWKLCNGTDLGPLIFRHQNIFIHNIKIYIIIPLQLFKSYCAVCDKFYKNTTSVTKILLT